MCCDLPYKTKGCIGCSEPECIDECTNCPLLEEDDSCPRNDGDMEG